MGSEICIRPLRVSQREARAHSRKGARVSRKGLDSSSKLGRLVFTMKDVAVRMKPDVRARVVRVFNTLDADQKDPALSFRLREDLDKLGREPQLASLVKMSQGAAATCGSAAAAISRATSRCQSSVASRSRATGPTRPPPFQFARQRCRARTHWRERHDRRSVLNSAYWSPRHTATLNPHTRRGPHALLMVDQDRNGKYPGPARSRPAANRVCLDLDARGRGPMGASV